jgi:hypothetical protein
VDFSRVLDALATRGFIRKYRVDDACFGVIPSFLRHQIINNRERESELPDDLTDSAMEAEPDACTTREPRVNHALPKSESGREGKGKEQEGKGKESSCVAADESAAPPHKRIKWCPDGGFYGIEPGDRQQWSEAFPACDIARQISAADLWLKANPSKSKKQNFYRFLTGWLTRSQERGGDSASSKPTNGYHRQSNPRDKQPMEIDMEEVDLFAAKLRAQFERPKTAAGDNGFTEPEEEQE